MQKPNSRQKHWHLLQSAAESSLSRRNFLRYLGSATALLSSSGCRWNFPDEVVTYLPEVKKASSEPVFIATAEPRSGFGVAILAEIYNQRPIKIEGHPETHSSRGASDAISQAQLLSLYHPHRWKNKDLNAEVLSTRVYDLSEKIQSRQGEETLVVLPVSTSSWQRRQIEKLKTQWPKARIFQVSLDPIFSYLSSTHEIFGESLWPVFDFSQVDEIFSFDADVFSDLPGKLAYARQFADRRSPEENDEMVWLYSLASVPSLTTAMSDHSGFLPQNSIERVIQTVYRDLTRDKSFQTSQKLNPEEKTATQTLKRYLKDRRKTRILIPGPTLSQTAQAQIWALNQWLKSEGLSYLAADELNLGEVKSYKELAKILFEEKKLSNLLVFTEDIVRHLGLEPKLLKRLKNIPNFLYFGEFQNKTSQAARIRIPLSHFMESWTDLKSYRGETLISQACIKPIFITRSREEWIGFCAQRKFPETRDFLRFLQSHYNKSSGEIRKRLQAGGPLSVLKLKGNPKIKLNPKFSEVSRQEAVFYLGIRPDPYLRLGQEEFNEWLQELPRPLTQLSWDNALVVSNEYAREHGFKKGDRVEIESFTGRKISLPVLPSLYLKKDLAYIYLGYGQTTGFWVEPFLPGPGTWSVPIQSVRKLKETYPLAVNQMQMQPAEVHPVIELSQEEFRQGSKELQRIHKEWSHQLKTLRDSEVLKLMLSGDVQWAMTIDLTRCIGCGACTLACQAENNIPSVGKRQALQGRIMHWIRIDHYVDENRGEKQMQFQPVPCMHCEKAPCELVCPVAATVHGQEGLNEMIYNRCVGTRFCANNCPYKVRRFNYFKFSKNFSQPEQLALNPEVTVRSRGIMEKCTYCVQRLQSKIEDPQTACQQACPTKAIEFGNMKKVSSKVARNRENPRHYPLLLDLGTLPRTTYLARIRNLREET